jgi:hypothetical protein
MSRRSKQNVKKWDSRIQSMTNEIPDAISVESRYRALRYLLVQEYPQLLEMDKELLLAILKDTDWLGRQLRLWNEANEKPLKDLLEQETIQELQR